MADFVLITGDQVQFTPAFGPAMVVVQPGVLAGSGRGLAGSRPVCVQGDEAKVIVPGCMYTSGGFSIPGVGALSIASLAPNQIALRTKSGGRSVLLKGATFIAKFQVMTPAQQPAPPGPPIPDPMPMYTGTGSFVTTNVRVKGT